MIIRFRFGFPSSSFVGVKIKFLHSRFKFFQLSVSFFVVVVVVSFQVQHGFSVEYFVSSCLIFKEFPFQVQSIRLCS